MPPRRSSIEKDDHIDYHSNADGLHVTEIEFPSSLPRYSVLSNIRNSTPFRHSRQNTQQTPVQSQRISSLPITNQISADILSNQDSHPRQPSPTSQATSNDEKEEERVSTLDRQWFGWTWRRWMYILGPCIAILVMVVVLVAVFVSRMNDGEGNNTSTTQSPNSTTTTATPSSPAPTSAPSASLKGVFNGTSISSAYSDEANDSLWVFYQNSVGNLAYIPMSNNGSWGSSVTLPTTNGVLNGTAIAALNYQISNAWKINVVYQDASGSLRNFLYNTKAATFSEGNFGDFNVPLPISPNVVKRLSWFTDYQNHHYLYYPGTDGLIHEYTYNLKANAWAPTFVFPESNGYSGCAAFYDEINSIATMHLINSANQLQMYWRNYTNSSTASQPGWTAGVSTTNAQTQLGFNLNLNSTLSLLQNTGQAIFAQESGTNKIWSVGWSGLRGAEHYTTGVPTNASALPDASLDIQYLRVWKDVNNGTHAFVQQTGDDITHLLQQDDGSFTFVEKLPL